jgi:hypothetical protein
MAAVGDPPKLTQGVTVSESVPLRHMRSLAPSRCRRIGVVSRQSVAPEQPLLCGCP